MSGTDDWAVPAPPFRPAEALVGLRRQLRELRPLAEQGARFVVRGQGVVELAAGDGCIDARLARRPARSTEWTPHRLASASDVRRFVELVKKQLPLWERDE